MPTTIKQRKRNYEKLKTINEKESPNNIKCTAGLTGGCGEVENIKIIIIL